MVVVGLGSYDPWTTTSQHVGMFSFDALTSVQKLAFPQRKYMYYVVTWATISRTRVQTASTSVPTVKTPEDIVR